MSSRAITREDPILGTVRRCSRCTEDWPQDETFYYRTQRGGWTGWCRACWAEYHAEHRTMRLERRRAAAFA